MITCTCNRCQSKFQADVTRSSFGGGRAARVAEFKTCPTCGQTDNHWVYAADVMPAFAGTAYQIKQQQQKWLNEN